MIIRHQLKFKKHFNLNKSRLKFLNLQFLLHSSTSTSASTRATSSSNLFSKHDFKSERICKWSALIASGIAGYVACYLWIAEDCFNLSSSSTSPLLQQRQRLSSSGSSNGSGDNLNADSTNGTPLHTYKQKPKFASTLSGPGMNFIADAVDKVKDSVVNISVETDTSKLFRKTTLVSSGSGFFIEPGVVLTNAHVVSDMVDSSRMIITTSDGHELDGYVFSLDTLADLAIVRIREKSLLSLERSLGGSSTFPWPAVEFGSQDNLRIGDWVAAIGSPFGLQNTVTAGVISSQSRKSKEIGGHDSRVRYIQTDCVVHSGSSGGPLINMDGRVVGINTTRAESEGISFAIRVAETTLDMVNQLRNEGRVVRPFLGFHMTTLTRAVWKQLLESGDGFRVPNVQNGKGVLITNVMLSSPAETSGIKVLDVVTHVNKTPVSSSHDLLSIVGLKIGAPISLRVQRSVSVPSTDPNLPARYTVEEHTLKVVPEELNIYMQQRIQQRRETGV